MKTCKYIIASELQKLCAEKKAIIIDIREREEYDREHIVNARSISLTELSKESIGKCLEGEMIVFHCQLGNRTNQAQDELANLGFNDVRILDGGINAWKKIKGEMIVNIKSPLPIMRQVQIIVGFMVVLGVVLSYLITPYFNLLSAFFGAGLLFAGISGHCGMAHVLMKLPYNNPKK